MNELRKYISIFSFYTVNRDKILRKLSYTKTSLSLKLTLVHSQLFLFFFCSILYLNYISSNFTGVNFASLFSEILIFVQSKAFMSKPVLLILSCHQSLCFWIDRCCFTGTQSFVKLCS